jgi:hypothetical protein
MTKSTITRDPITHYLKIYPEFFSAVCTGVKRAELRKNDRDYRVGDTLHLMETPRGSCHQTGEFINVKITHIADVGEWIPGYVLLSIEREAMDRKVAMDSEPYGYVNQFLYEQNGVSGLSNDHEYYHDSKSHIPLYRHAQPAPVVLDERAAFNAWNNEDNLPIAGVGAKNAAWLAWQARAMLQAEPVTTTNKLENTPVNGVTAGKPLTNGDVVTTKSRCTIQTAPALDSSQKNAESRCGNSSAIPDGYVMVPKEPTVNQWAAGMQAFDSGVDKVTRVYKAMLAAAPQEVNSWSSHYLPVTRGDAVGCPFNREEEP